MRVSEQTREALRAKGMELQKPKTRDSVADLNRLQKDCAQVVVALHLAC